ncbi:MAG: XdhC family protein [Ectobacillus sp.]
MTSVYEVWEAVASRNEPCVMATIIQTVGSSYQKEGAVMAMWEDGARLGMLSAGCIEEDLLCRAKELQAGGWLICEYDTSDEQDFLWTVGCNGQIRVLLEQVHTQCLEQLNAVVKEFQKGYGVRVIKDLSNNHAYFISDSGQAFGNLPNKHGDIYEQYIPPKPRLYIFGAGEDAKPLVCLAKTVGFSVTVCDWREQWCTQLRFPEADACIIGFPKEIVPVLSLASNDFVVIMTHHFQRDQELWELLNKQSLRYLGILGARQRTQRLCGGTIPDNVFAPVGLPIGARGPNEIAVSIVAEMIQVLRT